MTRFITQAVFNGTKVNLCLSGNCVNSILRKAQKDRILRNATVFLFFSRKTGKLIDLRYN